MQTHWIAETLSYDGSQLRAHWILRQTGLAGDAMVAFRGPCAVRDEEMADLEDVLDGPGIAGSDMLHFVSETFDDGDLLRAIHRQRLFAALVGERLRRRAGGADPQRVGDDLYLGPGKLSISIATRSQVSSLVHFALNISNAGTPVQTASLEDLGVDPADFAREVLGAWSEEEASIRSARAKVRAKGES